MDRYPTENKSDASISEYLLVGSQTRTVKRNDNGLFQEMAVRAAVDMCIQCQKCTAGCPVSSEMDFPPSQVVRLVQLNQKDKLIASQSIWLCTSCYTCATRCPSGVSPAVVQDGLRRISTVEAHAVADPRAEAAATSFIWAVAKSGRINELSLARHYKLKTKTYFEMFLLGITMFLKGKLRLLKQKVRRPNSIAAIVNKYLSRGDSKE